VLDVRQSTPPTPGQADKQPLHIPIAVGLLDAGGKEAPLQLEGEPGATASTRVLSVCEPEQRFRFVNVASSPVPSLLRSFSAPVQLQYPYSDADLAHLMAYDSDAFNRWEAGQRLALGILLRGIVARGNGTPFEVPASFATAFTRVLADAAHDPAFTAEALALPSEAYVGEQMEQVDPDAIHAVRRSLRTGLAEALRGDLLATYQAFAIASPYNPDARSAGQRAIKNACLSYLTELEDEAVRALCLRQFETADNMTDAMAALTAIANAEWAQRPGCLERFYEKWQHEPLVVDKWLAVQAGSRLPHTLQDVHRLTAHPAFDLKNPNKVYALIRTFCGNQVRFHAADGAGYVFAADHILALDPLNPQVAARLARAFDRWKKFDAARQAHARAQLERIRGAQGLSKDTLEVVTKALA
jgi:aminopeptidase N